MTDHVLLEAAARGSGRQRGDGASSRPRHSQGTRARGQTIRAAAPAPDPLSCKLLVHVVNRIGECLLRAETAADDRHRARPEARSAVQAVSWLSGGAARRDGGGGLTAREVQRA